MLIVAHLVCATRINQSPICACVEGFEPRETPKDVWESENSTDGCVRKSRLLCASGADDGFVEVPDVFFPSYSEYLEARNTEECRLACLRNCSCSAYAYYDCQCLIWKRDLYTIMQHTTFDETDQTLHIRVAASHLEETKATDRKTYWIVVSVLVGCFILLVFVVVTVKRYFVGESVLVEDYLVVFRYRDLRGATKNFSEKLGEGGFGSVFKGTLPPNSTVVAVKKLKNPKQGEKQFRAEVMTLGTIQHANLIHLRGFCAKKSMRFLVYDHMPNGSLESLLFQKSLNILEWRVRYQIAIGTAKGLCYH